jgi:hypothetical protein
VPDDQMPKILTNEGYQPAQVIMSPLSVVGRKNLGQIMETNEATGKGPSIDVKTDVVVHGNNIKCTAGVQYIMRLDHIAEKTLSAHADEISATKEYNGARLGEMESILLSTNEDRLKILGYLRHQDQQDSHKKLQSLLKAVGVDMKGVNWNS